jgi:hypothetical protein
MYSFLRPLVSSRGVMRFPDCSDEGTASDFVQIKGKLRRRTRQGLHGKSKFTETEKGEKGEEQCQKHANHFL